MTEPMTTSTTVELFVDLNCPFCFCQVERVMRHDLVDAVVWKGIEHEPDLPVVVDRHHPLAASIQEELQSLREREPDFVVNDPGFRPNVRVALDALTAVQQTRPALLWPTLQTFFRALWREGRDISDRDVVDALLHECNVGDVVVTDVHRRVRQGYTEQWRTGPFEERLPSARSAHGALLLGLNDEERFVLFAKSGLFTVRGGQSC